MVPVSPAAQTSPGPLPHTENRSFVVPPTPPCLKASPLQWRIVPPAPTTQRSSVVPLATGPHAVPSQWTMVPSDPTAQASSAPLPQTAERTADVPLGIGLHPTPSQWRIVPALPTTQTSLAPLPHTACSEFPWGSGVSQHQPSGLQTAAAPPPASGPASAIAPASGGKVGPSVSTAA